MKKIYIFIYVIILLNICYADDDCTNSYPNCDQFPQQGEGDELKKCINMGSYCELKKCSELESGLCSYFGADSRGFKCSSKVYFDSNLNEVIEQGCALQQCSDYPIGYCHWFEDDDAICDSKDDHTGCVSKSCSDYRPGECNRANFPKAGIQCVESQDRKSCITQKCSDYNSNECSNFIPNNSDYAKCLPDGDGCKIKECYDITPPNCETFNPMKKDEFTCAEFEGRCVETIKNNKKM